MSDIVNFNNELVPQEEDNNSSKKYTSHMPSTDLDVMTTGRLVVRRWLEMLKILLLWTTAEKYSTAVERYALAIGDKRLTEAERKEISGELGILGTTMVDTLKYLKSRVSEKVGEAKAISIYPQFGMVSNRSISFPRTQQERMGALEMVVPAIVKYGLEDMHYGLEFWTDLRYQYSALYNKKGYKDSDTSISTAEKNELKKYLRKTNRALANVLQANYPDTYKSELRAWGFHREKY